MQTKHVRATLAYVLTEITKKDAMFAYNRSSSTG